MLSENENETKPIRKSAARKGKTGQEGKKAEPRKRKAAPRQDPQPDQSLETVETIDVSATPAENILTDTSPSEASPVVPVAAAETDQQQDLQPDQLPEAAETISAPVTLIETIQFEVPSSEEDSAVPDVPTVAEPVSYQAIADAYRRYTTESLDRTQTFFGRLAGVRSLDKAFELQTEFAKQAYDGFVAESRKIRELHSQLARQRLKQWEGLVARMMGPR
jgi:hypothetical protein